jgi:hypothetical protein
LRAAEILDSADWHDRRDIFYETINAIDIPSTRRHTAEVGKIEAKPIEETESTIANIFPSTWQSPLHDEEEATEISLLKQAVR